jgi:hypothetical protein
MKTETLTAEQGGKLAAEDAQQYAAGTMNLEPA